MAQTETNAFRKCLKASLADDDILSRILVGGVHFGTAPAVDKRTRKPLESPYMVIRIITAPNSIANGARRVMSTPLVRVLVHGKGNGNALVQQCDQAARRADTILETVRYTATDEVTDAGPAEPIEIRGFYNEQQFDTEDDDGAGNLKVMKGGDYRGIGYRLPNGDNACA